MFPKSSYHSLNLLLAFIFICIFQRELVRPRQTMQNWYPCHLLRQLLDLETFLWHRLLVGCTTQWFFCRMGMYIHLAATAMDSLAWGTPVQGKILFSVWIEMKKCFWWNINRHLPWDLRILLFQYTWVFMFCLLFRGVPTKVPLPLAAVQIAAGSHHTVILLTSGQVYTCGDYQVNFITFLPLW